MWKSIDSEVPTSARVNSPQSPSTFPAEIRGETSFSAKQTQHSMIGKSITIKGEIVASEPLYILGRVEGTINAPNDRVTVGSGGKVNADISAREVVIMGEVCGNIEGADRVDLRKDGSLTGNLAAHHFSMEEGAFLKGVVDVCAPIEKVKVEESELDRAEITPVAELKLAG